MFLFTIDVYSSYIAGAQQKHKHMKNMQNIISLVVLALLPAAAASCDSIFLPSGEGEIRMAFLKDAITQTRAGISPSDTNSFILRITDSKGKTIYDGAYGASPESIAASPGSYTIKVMSSEFSTPAFSTPQYGDTQTVTVRSGETTDVTLVCRQINAGIRLNIDPKFLTAYPAGSLHLKSDEGKLLYSYSEKRIAYFNPGTVSLILSNGGTDERLLSRSLSSQEVYTINVSVAQAPSGSAPSAGSRISVQLDTSRNWISENYTIGGNANKGSSHDNPYSVSEARSMGGTEDVWVYGYIVGGDLSAKNCSFTPPFTSRTNLALSSKQNCTDRNVCLSVQLAKGDVRDALNLVDHEDLLGRKVYVKGNIVESYYGLPGIQEITEYAFE